jgi:hypothetical protein
MPLQTPSSKPDPNDPYDPVEPGRPFTRFELAMARIVNSLADLRATLEESAAVARVEATRRAQQAAAEQARAKARLERARQWVRDHPDAQ